MIYGTEWKGHGSTDKLPGDNRLVSPKFIDGEARHPMSARHPGAVVSQGLGCSPIKVVRVGFRPSRQVGLITVA